MRSIKTATIIKVRLIKTHAHIMVHGYKLIESIIANIIISRQVNTLLTGCVSMKSGNPAIEFPQTQLISNCFAVLTIYREFSISGNDFFKEYCSIH